MVVQVREARPEVVIGEGDLGIDQIVVVACAGARVKLSQSEAFADRLQRSRAVLLQALEKEVPVYGVTTGYGESCGNMVAADLCRELGDNLIRYHGCGVGEPLGECEARAAILCRLIGLARGYSGVSRALLEALADLLNRGITPVIPCRGSVGASGDLTPLSYVAACLAGEREVFHRGRRVPASRALEVEGLEVYRFEPKEQLALINGTSVMTGIAAVVIARCRSLLEAAVRASALTVHALAGHAYHFRPALFAAKPHPGQADVAARIRRLLDGPTPAPETDDPDWLQDPYSVRCSPHVLGVLADALQWVERWVEVEANSANDNPLFDPDSGEVLLGGNFYGGHVAFAMDGLKAAMASAADMMDRQVALLVDERFSRGLPANLVKAEHHQLHHGLKGLQITASALTAEACKGTMPAAVFSRSTESHNQDKVSLGTIAARDAQEVCGLVCSVAAIHLLAAVQAAEIRGHLSSRPALAPVIAALRKLSDRVAADRPLDEDIERVAAAIADSTLFGTDHESSPGP